MKKKKKKLSTRLSGVAGEYIVAGELSRRGYIASITLKNTEGVDILVSNSRASKAISIQVKTKQGTGKEWVLSKKAEDYFGKNIFYVFVNLNNGGQPDFFIVPSYVVAKFTKACHKQYIQRHKDNPMRKFQVKDSKYLNRWKLLGL